MGEQQKDNATHDDTGHPLERQPDAVDDAQDTLSREDERTHGEAREPYAGTSSDPDAAWDRATESP